MVSRFWLGGHPDKSGFRYAQQGSLLGKTGVHQFIVARENKFSHSYESNPWLGYKLELPAINKKNYRKTNSCTSKTD